MRPWAYMAIRFPPLCCVALGTNVGDRLRHLSKAVRSLSRLDGIRIRMTSSLYSTRAQYVTDQPDFLNAMLYLELAPPWSRDLHRFLLQLKCIEDALGRQTGGLRWGPREVDLDIVAVGSAQETFIDHAHPLIVPHPRLHERDFVLAPMAELCPAWRHPGFSHQPTVSQMLAALPNAAGRWDCTVSSLYRVLPLAGGLHGLPEGLFCKLELPRQLRFGTLAIRASCRGSNLHAAEQHVHDVAGSVAEAVHVAGLDGVELRLVPTSAGDGGTALLLSAVRGVRSTLVPVTISVRTTLAETARAAVAEGADWIIDESGGQSDINMLPAVADLMCPVVLGEDPVLQPQKLYDVRQPEPVLEGMFGPLRRQAAEAAGVARWNIIAHHRVRYSKAFTFFVE